MPSPSVAGAYLQRARLRRQCAAGAQASADLGATGSSGKREYGGGRGWAATALSAGKILSGSCKFVTG